MVLAPLLLLSSHYSDRPEGSIIDTIVLHSMFNVHPECGESFDVKACAMVLGKFEVSAHYLIGRRGELVCLVPEEKQAWHAGESVLPADGRSKLNQTSIGIELIANYESGYTDLQYETLVELIEEIASRFPIRFITGHSDIAPTRKTDPWNFDWDRLKGQLKKPVVSGILFSHLPKE